MSVLDQPRQRELPQSERRPGAPTPPLATPYLVLDIAAATQRYRRLACLFSADAVHYAVKANPHPVLVSSLVAAGSRFDVASAGEVDLCLAAGARPEQLLYSNPMKRRTEIEHAYGRGVRVFAADSPDEIGKLSETAPGAEVLVRLSTSGEGSDWPLSGKFGCSAEEAYDLLVFADTLGLRAAGIAFHVGSQQREPMRWERPIAAAAGVFARLRHRGIRSWLLDVGGGLPADHLGGQPDLPTYATVIRTAVERHFRDRPRLVIEPGRGIAGDAGTLVSSVLGVTWRGGRRWVYLDAGVYTGLVETLGESIRYRLETNRADAEVGPAVLAGPTCDSVDVLYQDVPVQLPLDLAEGDEVRFRSAGAYTTSYSTVGFNGFPPLPTVVAGVRSSR